MYEVNPTELLGKNREYLKKTINTLETNNKNKNIRGFYRGIYEL
jgi:predicted nuclease of restriction endonuclease-like RecB superfamily